MSFGGVDVGAACVVLGCLRGKNTMLSELLLVELLDLLVCACVERARLEEKSVGVLTVGEGNDQGLGGALAYVRSGGLKMWNWAVGRARVTFVG